MSEPTAIVIAPPWLRTGTGRVIEAQIAYYRSRGFRTAFIGVANHPEHIATDPIWHRFRQGADDLCADRVFIAALPRRAKPRTLWRYARRLVRGDTALDWIVAIGSLAELPGDVIGFTHGKPPAIIHANHVYTLGFVKRLAAKLSPLHIPTIVETHDVQSHIVQDNDYENPWTRRPDRMAQLLRREIKMLSVADVLVHLSADDLAFFKARLPNKPHVLAMPPIMATPPTSPDTTTVGSIDLLFVGTGHIANLQAVEWLFEKVWPHLSRAGMKLTIAGAIDELVRLRLPELYAGFRAHFAGAVPAVEPYYRAARCVIAPMVSGRGISIKTIEALAFGRPFVGTSKAFRGLPTDVLAEAGLRPHDDPRGFAEAALSAIGAKDDGARNRALYDRLFSQSGYFLAMDEANRVARRHRRRTDEALRGRDI